MYPGTFTAIDAGVKSESLLASSLFCLFQGDQIANTFTVIDPKGDVVDELGKVAALMRTFTKKYAAKAAKAAAERAGFVATTGAGLPEPENPFVLGYGISQKVKEELRGEPTFKPLNFQFSVTGVPLEKHNFATLNFLMLTKSIDELSNVEKNLNAGYFRQTFFELIHAEYADAGTGRPVFDAVMGISRDLFVRQYISPQVLQTYTPQLPQISGFQTFSNPPVNALFSVLDNGHFATSFSQQWWTNTPKRQSSHWTEQKLGFSHFERWTGTTETCVEYWCDNTTGLPVNGKRVIKVKVTGSMSSQLDITNDIFPNGGASLRFRTLRPH